MVKTRKMPIVSLKLPAELYERLNRLAEETGRTRSFYIRQLIEKHLDELEDIYLAEETLERVRAGEEKLYTLDEAETEFGL